MWVTETARHRYVDMQNLKIPGIRYIADTRIKHIIYKYIDINK